jgi:hypothetical protein
MCILNKTNKTIETNYNTYSSAFFIGAVGYAIDGVTAYGSYVIASGVLVYRRYEIQARNAVCIKLWNDTVTSIQYGIIKLYYMN